MTSPTFTGIVFIVSEFCRFLKNSKKYKNSQYAYLQRKRKLSRTLCFVTSAVTCRRIYREKRWPTEPILEVRKAISCSFSNRLYGFDALCSVQQGLRRYDVETVVSDNTGNKVLHEMDIGNRVYAPEMRRS
jgi:hypothetical protein